MATSRKVAVAIVLVFPPSSPSSSSSATAATPPPAALPEPSFLLVSSRKKEDRYVFPKGGVEHGESSAQAAEREAWEEAGLEIGSATHLTHLLTLSDPSPHILSPSTDPTSPSFVPSCEYSFELFVLPPPTTAAAGDASSSSAISALPSSSAPEDSTNSSTAPATSSASSETPTTASALPSSAAASFTTHPSLPPLWPESTERHRRLLPHWAALEKSVCWGRREGVMREAVQAAKGWVEEDLEAEEGLIAEAVGRRGAE
ncbi:hypothetical protein JCM6882_004612 [Rhodosporidiobolus microsporus]